MSAIGTNAYSMTSASSTELVSGLTAGRYEIHVFNVGNNGAIVYLGNSSSVTSSNGYALYPSKELVLRVLMDSTDALWGSITTTGSNPVSVMVLSA